MYYIIQTYIYLYPINTTDWRETGQSKILNGHLVFSACSENGRDTRIHVDGNNEGN